MVSLSLSLIPHLSSLPILPYPLPILPPSPLPLPTPISPTSYPTLLPAHKLAVPRMLICARTGLKKLNNWPTFPQLIVRGEFVGGLDVVQEMVENGELREIVGGP